jgi:hypothetical protein
MAFQSNAQQSPQNDSWKAQGFLNFSLPLGDGKFKKLGSIPLKDAKPAEKELMAWLQKDPANVLKLLAKLRIDFQSAQPADVAGFSLD